MTRRLKKHADLPSAKRSTVHSLLFQAFMVRGIQIFIVGLGVYLAIFEGRG